MDKTMNESQKHSPQGTQGNAEEKAKDYISYPASHAVEGLAGLHVTNINRRWHRTPHIKINTDYAFPLRTSASSAVEGWTGLYVPNINRRWHRTPDIKSNTDYGFPLRTSASSAVKVFDWLGFYATYPAVKGFQYGVE